MPDIPPTIAPNKTSRKNQPENAVLPPIILNNKNIIIEKNPPQTAPLISPFSPFNEKKHPAKIAITFINWFIVFMAVLLIDAHLNISAKIKIAESATNTEEITPLTIVL